MSFNIILDTEPGGGLLVIPVHLFDLVPVSTHGKFFLKKTDRDQQSLAIYRMALAAFQAKTSFILILKEAEICRVEKKKKKLTCFWSTRV